MHNTPDKYSDRRHAPERRKHNDSTYSGSERRSGFDSHEWQETTPIKANNTPKAHGINTPWPQGYG